MVSNSTQNATTPTSSENSMEISVSIITFTIHHRRPPAVSHDHCYCESAKPHTAGVFAMETGSSSPESETKRSEVKDNRRCLFCSVEGDAPCMVSWPHPPTTPFLKSPLFFFFKFGCMVTVEKNSWKGSKKMEDEGGGVE